MENVITSTTDASRRRSGAVRYVVIFLAIVAAVLAVTAAANYLLNPLTFDRGAMAEVSRILVSQKNYAALDPNIDWRGLRREHIKAFDQTPDVIVFSGSRWQEATSNLFPQHRFYNSFVHSDYFEDILAISEILESANRLPKTLIISVRYQTFSPIDQRNSNLWQLFAPETRRMAEQLQIPTHSWFESYHFDYWLNLFSLRAAAAKIAQHVDRARAPGPTDSLSDDNLDIIGADGAIHFSGRHQAQDTPERARQRALAQADIDRNKSIVVDPVSVEGLKRLITRLQDRGVTIVLAQTPYHPAYYEALAGTRYRDGLEMLQGLAAEIGTATGAAVIGSLDPAAVGCAAADFRDHLHSRESCLGRVTRALDGRL